MTPTALPPPVLRTLSDAAASDALGRDLARIVVEAIGATSAMPDGGFTMHFSGDLGAGKTTVVRALLRALGVEGRVKSPTYTLVEPYVIHQPTKGVESRRNVNLYCYHFDFYRFQDPHEWLEAGFRDYFSDAALRLVEWPERARSDDGTPLPPPDVRVALENAGDGRVARIAALTERGAAWLSGRLDPPREPADAS